MWLRRHRANGQVAYAKSILFSLTRHADALSIREVSYRYCVHPALLSQ
jgi:hypothetical protein